MSYHITDYSYKQAKNLKVIIKPSTRKDKKIDVFKDNKKVASIGNKNYMDYPTYIETKGKKYAEKRRELYKKRHKNDIDNGAGFYADKILW